MMTSASNIASEDAAVSSVHLTLSAQFDNVLAKIVEDKKVEVATRMQHMPIDELKKDLAKSTRSLEKAMGNSGADFILECKKASPSKGLIREDFNLDEILADYRDFASAISVLTDNKYFQGQFTYLKKASEQTELPILCKDFFIDPYQVYEARYHGADAILLMLSVLDNEQYQLLASIAQSLSLDVLTEVHSEQELERALALGAKIIGINNRNLKDLSIDLATTESLVSMIPEDRIVISESGISTHNDIKRLAPVVDGFLVGSSIMQQRNIRHHLKSLIFGNIKICGLTKPEDAVNVDLAGGNYGGLVFFPPSKRHLTIEQAQTITAAAPLRYVGVFVDEEADSLVTIAKALNLYAVQLHGNEDAAYVKTIRDKLDHLGLEGIQIWKAIRVEQSIAFTPDDNINQYLLDAFHPTERGGSGEAFDWSLLASLDSMLEKQFMEKQKFILAGGIDEQNLAQALDLDLYALDLSSGVESSPGEKSPHKIDAFFKKLSQEISKARDQLTANSNS
ncbi:bifunctional indole-3-glycerol-phosphate synthase TrpC/phosphoribosylanthranilate isomerase TrpF [Aliikangiella sp. G2MR2-5]|uniref:bifunctional indole-3-glycerol-phosphate synthase TrpC/phosphoribosylanthranilate isomerase TrpF n=1 Tax=Aliikangiella sp. G2MR2-5 TaxID=2788943 RepID=UPI001AEF2A26|nr:bifunctional indole-3-glycerol-phosphate synthase TrpC/phosphoribosylanthranilate isomerase TrpF [Aliikangiella sp. G2MR2-5]